MSKVYTINTGNKAQFLSEYALVSGSNITGSFTGSLTGRLTGTASWADSASRAITVAPNSVTLGTDTTGNYVGTLTQGRGITVSGGTGEGTSNTILLGSGSSAYNISGSGNWFTVARRVGSNGRGVSEVFIYSSGGDTAPAHMKLLWNTDWGGVSSIRVVNNTFLPSTLIIGAIRATYTGSTQTAELEVQSNSATNATINSIVVDYSTAGSSTTPIVTASANLPTSVQIPMSYFYDGVIMSSGSNVGIGTLNPSASLDVPFAGGIGRPTMLFGATDGGFTRTDATQKIFRLAGAHYTNAQTPYTVIMGVGDSANNEVRIGGGTSQLNGATIVSFWTTGSNTAPAQNYRWQITADGIFQSNGAQTIRSSTGNLTLSTGGGNGHILLTPNGTGNVGIGTTNPVVALHVERNNSGILVNAGASAVTGSAIKFRNDGYQHWTIGSHGSGLRISTTGDNGNTIWGNNPSDKLTILTGGNVGIGTTNPANTLQIQGNVSASSYTSSISDAVGYFGTASRAVSASRADSSALVDVLSGGSTTGLGIYSGSFSGSFFGNSSTGNVGPGTVNSIALFNATTTVSSSIIFQNNNNIGVGTTSAPNFKIEVSGSVGPSADNQFDLGSSTRRWANLYTGDLNLSNEGSMGNIIDGTTGNWTIQEGEEYLYIINKKSGKRYRFMLEEVE